MSDKEMNGMEPDIIDFEDEEGNTIPFEVIDYLFYNGEEYALLVEATEDDSEEERQECIVCLVAAETEEEIEPPKETACPIQAVCARPLRFAAGG